MSEYRIRELTDHGDWPWRYIVERRVEARWRKRWPWSREAKVFVPAGWEQQAHGRRGYQPLQDSDAHALLNHYQSARNARRER